MRYIVTSTIFVRPKERTTSGFFSQFSESSSRPIDVESTVLLHDTYIHTYVHSTMTFPSADACIKSQCPFQEFTVLSIYARLINMTSENHTHIERAYILLVTYSSQASAFVGICLHPVFLIRHMPRALLHQLHPMHPSSEPPTWLHR
jgi:hypothetical protein